MEYIKCILCNEDRTGEFLSAGDRRYGTSDEYFNLVRCMKCGLVYMNPRPDKSEVGKYYPVNYRPRKTLSASHIEKRMKKYLSGKIALFFSNPWRLDMPKGANVLDIGCGSGELLLLLEKIGCNPYGLDVDEVTSNYLKNEMKLKVETCDIDSGSPFQDEFFDVVFMRHSLEHFHNPLAVLREVRRILKKNGELIVGIPNIDSFIAEFTDEYWGDLDIPRHLFHFNTSTIEALLDRAGFTVEKIDHEMKVSRKSLKKKLSATPLLSFLAAKPMARIIGTAAVLLRKSEWIVVKARKADG